MTTIPFGTQLIGRTEKALNAILERHLAGTGITEPQWVALTLTVTSGGTLPEAAVVDRIRQAQQVDAATAAERVAELTAAGLVRTAADGTLAATERGTAQWSSVRAATGRVTEQLWGDLPEAELAVAARVLNTVLTRTDDVR
ncbi:winged helix DNA-binding protein [Actinoplanes sp. NBC_00393]|uniref:MarR family winged helix-turn-helix transcriptional regulator n=1 Tax=Actinoplanes sp. NBC_00393 TaxID=2975953 RepID=UPI002E215A06